MGDTKTVWDIFYAAEVGGTLWLDVRHYMTNYPEDFRPPEGKHECRILSREVRPDLVAVRVSFSVEGQRYTVRLFANREGQSGHDSWGKYQVIEPG